MEEHWADSIAVLKCMEGLDRIKHSDGHSDASVLAYIELLRRDLENIEYVGPTTSACDSKLIDVIYRYHLMREKSPRSIHEVYELLKKDVINLLAICVLGMAIGNWEEAKTLCRSLHMASLAYDVRVG